MQSFLESSNIQSATSDTAFAARSAALAEAAHSLLGPLFQVFDSFYQTIFIPKILDIILVLFNLVQLLFTSFWLPHSNWAISTEISEKFIRYFQSIFNLMPFLNIVDDSNVYSEKVENNYFFVCFLLYLIIFLLSAGNFLFQYFCAKNRGRLIVKTLYLSKFMIVYVPALMLHPTAIMTGKCFSKFVNYNSDLNLKERNKFIIFFVVLLLEYIYFVTTYYFSFNLLNYSAYLQSSLISAFDNKILLFATISSATIQLFSFIMPVYPGWSIYFMIGLHLLISIYFIIKLAVSLPFANFSSNVIILSVLAAGFFFDIVRLILVFIPKDIMNGTFVIISLFGVYFVSLLFSYLWVFVYRERKLDYINELIIKYTNPNDENGIAGNKSMNSSIESLTPTMQNDIFLNELKLANSQRSCFNFLYIVISNNIRQFIDLSIFKFISSTFPEPDCTIRLMRLIAFFPCFTPFLNRLYTDVLKNTNMSVFQKFFLYEIQRIKINRQSSSSIDASESLKILSSHEKEIEANIRFFWDQTSFKPQELCGITTKIGRLQTLWEEEIGKYKNSSQHYSDYEKFLVECKTDFVKGIHLQYRKKYLELGNTFRSDSCFALFVSAFPDFLKKKILNVNGQMIKANSAGMRKGSSSANETTSSSNSSGGGGTSLSLSSNSSSSDMDMQIEQEIGKELFTHSRLRITLQNATDSKHAKSATKMIYGFAFIIILNLAMVFYTYFQFRNIYDSQVGSLERKEKATKMRFHMLNAEICLMYYQFYLEDYRYLDYLNESNTFEPFFNTTLDWQNRTSLHNSLARDYYGLFMDDMAKLSATGINLYKFAPELFSKDTNMPCCKMGVVPNSLFIRYKGMDIKQVFMASTTRLNEMVMRDRHPIPMIWDKEPMATIINSSRFLIQKYSQMTTTMTSFIVKDLSDLMNVIVINYIVVPLGVFFFSLITLIVVFILYFREIQKFISLLLNMPKKVKKQAQNAVLKDNNNYMMNLNLNTNKFELNDDKNGKKENTITTPPTAHARDVFVPFVLVIMLLLVIALCNLFNFELIRNECTTFTNLQNWASDAGIMKSNIIEMWYFTVLRVLHWNNFTNNYMHNVNLTDNFDYSWNEISETLKKIMSAENESSSTFIGLSDELDDLVLKQGCESEISPDFHELYRCASSHQLISIFGSSLMSLLNDPDIYNGTLSGDVLMNLPHFVSVHIVPNLIKIDDYFLKIANDSIDKVHTFCDIYFAIGLVLIFVLGMLLFMNSTKLNSLYKIVIILMRRVIPYSLVANKQLMNFLLHRKMNDSNSNEMLAERRIVHSSKDAVICIDQRGIIEIVNTAVADIFGFSPEQLLGQSITCLISPDDVQLFQNQMNLMLGNQSSPIFEGNITCLSDDESPLKCKITILAMSSTNALHSNALIQQATTNIKTLATTLMTNTNNLQTNTNTNNAINTTANTATNTKSTNNNNAHTKSSNIGSFVIILRDQSMLISHQQKAEEAKKKSETLLYEILPRNIVIRLNQGEKDISFTVPSSTIMFVDIVKFSEYSTHLSPQEMLRNLSIIFGSFDTAIQNFPLLLKIKLIGDVYMCAGGLFTPEENPMNHAYQMAQFSLEVLQILEEVNMKLNSVLNVRIGVNTGGPLIAGVLGSEKPTFDIIGDPINIAARLQSTDIPGNVQISQGTYELLKNLNDFQIEQRGEIMLKGKGKMMTYMILPTKASLSNNSELYIDRSSEILNMPTV